MRISDWSSDVCSSDLLPAMSEDCLSLNVWAPDDAKDAPVFVWIHGGSLVAGSGGDPLYDGSALAKRGLVVVSINYRLGMFGWFAHQALSAEIGRASCRGGVCQSV